jgi:hypothetical protein
MDSKVIGIYQFQNSRLKKINDSLELVIGNRKKPTITKPLNYLLICLPNNKFAYLSSMYQIGLKSPVNDLQVYSIEVDSIEYQLSINPQNKIAKIEYLDIAKKHNIIHSQANSLV